MRVVFLGTPDFALPSLQGLCDAGYDVVGVFSQPDRKQGRGMQCRATPVKELALRLGLNVFQYGKISSPEGAEKLMALQPDVMVTAAFGQILSRENLQAPRLGCVNVHASLLPKYRGAAPIQWAVINGERSTGVTTMMTDIGLDTGDILLQKQTDIREAETAGQLFVRLAALGAQTLLQTLKMLQSGSLVRTPQDESEATRFPMLKKEHGHIDFTKTPRQIVDLVRGTTPWPGAFVMLNNMQIKVFECNESEQNGCAGRILAATKEGLLVGAKSGSVEITQMQPPGKKRMSGADFLRGRPGVLGDCLL